MRHYFPCSPRGGRGGGNITVCKPHLLYRQKFIRLDTVHVMVVNIFPMIPNLSTHLTHTEAHIQAEEKTGLKRKPCNQVGVGKCGGTGDLLRVRL